jgi:epoxyqueuosine reductase
MASLEESIREFAQAAGFPLVGIAPATEADSFDRLQEWLDRGYSGEMAYMERQSAARRRPDSILPDVRSIIMVAMNYSESGQGSKETWRQGDEAEAIVGKISRYAAGPDYHDVIWQRMGKVVKWLHAEKPACHARAVADTAPLLERDFARRAGLGWIGKNTMLINKHRGSYFFLGAILTDLELKPNPPHQANHCGTCTACLDACPTSAFPEPGVLDARKCISYLTIELRSPVPAELRPGMGDWLFGCDVCQEVCPWNRHDETFAQPVDAIDLLSLDEESFRQRFRDTAIMRSKRRGMLRNAALVLGNSGDERALPALRQALNDQESLVREAVEWAIRRIEQRLRA